MRHRVDGRYNYLLKNIGFLAIGNFSTKLLSFFLVPLYTSILTTADYGNYDLVSTTVNLLIPILTLNIADGTLRYSLDSSSLKQEVFSISIRYYIAGIIGMIIVLGLNAWLGLFKVIIPYSGYLLIMFATTAMNNILSSFARGINKVKEVSIAGVLGSLVIILLNIVFLVVCGFGLTGYFYANIIGVLAQISILFVNIKSWRYLKLHTKVNTEVNDKMRKYSFPLIANNLAWWVNNASDRYMVTWICGVAENGIYSVAYKIPSILSILQSIFQQAWTLSAVRDFNSKNRDAYFTRVYNMLNFILVIGCSGLIMFDKILARFLYANDFYVAWKYVPILLMAMIFSGMANFIGGIFQAVGDTKIIMKSTILAASVNIVLNAILIYFTGAIGAAIATMISNIINWGVRLHRSRKYADLRIKLKRDVCVYILLIIQSIILFLDLSVILMAVAEIVGFIIILLCYKHEFQSIYAMVKSKINK